MREYYDDKMKAYPSPSKKANRQHLVNQQWLIALKLSLLKQAKLLMQKARLSVKSLK
jgi:hypothetical protein